MEFETGFRWQRYTALARAFLPPENGAPRDMTLAYTRLFLGPGQPSASPYESVYLEGCLLGEAAAQVAECYAEAGFQFYSNEVLNSLSTGCEFPDHISIELAFMSHLAAREQNDSSQTEVWRERQRHFLREHLARWLTQFCEKVEASEEALPFYCEAARTVKRLVEEDVTRLISLANPNRYPNIRLEVNITLCTLCTLCVDNCHASAITVNSTPSTLSLAFDPSQCNGCRVCLRICPERAVTINLGPALAAPLQRQADILVTSSRVVCPECHEPHIAEPWLDRLVERLGSGESARRSLALCPFCKAKLQDALPILTGLTEELFPSV